MNYSKWMIAFDQKRNRVIISKRCLKRFKHNPKDPLVERDLARYWSNWCCKLLFWRKTKRII